MHHAGPFRGAETQWLSKEENSQSFRGEWSWTCTGPHPQRGHVGQMPPLFSRWIWDSLKCHPLPLALGDRISLISAVTWPLSVSTQHPRGNHRKMRLQQRSWQVRSLDMDLASADPCGESWSSPETADHQGRRKAKHSFYT